MRLDFEYDWEIKGTIPFALSAIKIQEILESYMLRSDRTWLELSPFIYKLYNSQVYLTETQCIVITHQMYHVSGSPIIDQLKDKDIIARGTELLLSKEFPTFDDISKTFDQAFLFDKYIYVGSVRNNHLSFHHVQSILLPFLNQIVWPEIQRINKARVEAVIPSPPAYNIRKILDNIFIIESHNEAIQGTCFRLKDIGFVTCEHSIREDSYIFSSENHKSRFNVKNIRSNATIDLAIFDVEEFDTNEGLELGNSDEVKLNSHVAVAGFPNHKYGDSGIFSPGLIVGFRPVSSIQRMLVNIPLIAGNSGGPALDKDSNVIGVVVTGADRMEEADKTENHGLVPISAITFLIN